MICNGLIDSHLTTLVPGYNTEYTVVHSNKKAVFILKKPNDSFGEIKTAIANYFGLPQDAIFLSNMKHEILLPNQYVLDELFPLQSSKVIGDKPTINVVFRKNMRTLDYILGDPNEKRAKIKRREDEKKEREMADEKKRKIQQNKDRDDTMERMRVDEQKK